MPKVLHLLSTAQPRGAELFAIRLADRLQQDGLENVICSIAPQGKSAVQAPEGIPFHSLNISEGRNPLTFLLTGTSRLKKLIGETRPDVVIGHGSSTLKYAAYSKLKVKSASTVYVNIGVASHWAKSAVKRRMNRLLLRKIDRVVSVSRYTKADFQAHYGYPAERTEFIANGVEVSRFADTGNPARRKAARTRLGLGEDALVLMTVGSLTAEKNQASLVPVLLRLRAGGLDAHLVIVGTGELAGHLTTPEARAFMHLPGYVADITQVLTAADVFVLPSKTEGMPGVLIEAGLAGLPSVAFNVGGISEVVDDRLTGFLATPFDYRQFGDHVESLLRSSELRRRMGNAASDRCRAYFSMEKVASDYRTFLLGLRGNSRSGVHIEPGAGPVMKERA